jgi:hypothetical protein
MAHDIKSYAIYQGDTGPLWQVGFTDGRTLGSYTCHIAVRGTSINRQVTTVDGTNTKFQVQLTAAETGTLSITNYDVGIELRNTSASPPFYREVHLILQVEPQIVV